MRNFLAANMALFGVRKLSIFFFLFIQHGKGRESVEWDGISSFSTFVFPATGQHMK
jgi:energy-converting hydrogenase Eha subunit G